MAQKVFFLHSAGPQGPDEGSTDFIAWLTEKLGDRYELLHPAMPHPENPDYDPWKLQLDTEFGNLHGDVLLIGHSLGGSVLLKYLATNKTDFTVKGLFLCAVPFWGMDGWDYEPFTLAPDFAQNLPSTGEVHIYHSKDDPQVTFNHALRYEKDIPHATLHPIDGDSHVFENGIDQLVSDITILS